MTYKNIKFVHLFSLAVIVFISAGMPVLHPVLHDHDDHRHYAMHDGLADDDTLVNAHDSHCPVCDFLATTPFQSSGYTSVEPIPALSPSSVLKRAAAAVKPFSSSLMTRAPPGIAFC